MEFKTRVVEIVPYNPVWKAEFERRQALLMALIGDLALGIEHVGSTSVEGLAAKPILDIDVVIECMAVFPAVKERLEQAGYRHMGNLDVEGREVFHYDHNDGLMRYHLYVCPQEGKGYLEHIAFRDYLREHPDARDAYTRLKQDLAKKYPSDVDSYCDHKTDFIQGILYRTLFSGDSS